MSGMRLQTHQPISDKSETRWFRLSNLNEPRKIGKTKPPEIAAFLFIISFWNFF